MFKEVSATDAFVNGVVNPAAFNYQLGIKGNPAWTSTTLFPDNISYLATGGSTNLVVDYTLSAIRTQFREICEGGQCNRNNPDHSLLSRFEIVEFFFHSVVQELF